MAARIAALAARFRDPVVACFGLTYKPDVDDLRESPAIAVVRALAERGGMAILVCDPWVETLPPRLVRAHGGSPGRAGRGAGAGRRGGVPGRAPGLPAASRPHRLLRQGGGGPGWSLLGRAVSAA
ncbi:MAG: UDP binding domain-containing protein [Acetobacteraceae bacterium]|nr:UDP binding domain-containing protein [Acetobacteraceae bacterium]